MRTFAIIGSFVWCGSLFAQISVDVPVVLDGPVEQRVINGLGPPVEGTDAISVGTAASGILNWAQPSLDLDTVELTTTPPVPSVAPGLLLRFVANSSMQRPGWLAVDGGQPHPLVRTDGGAVPFGAFRPDVVAEVMFAGNAWVVLNATAATCPPNTTAVNERLCIERTSAPGLKFYEAIARCGDLGGKLCTWDEYIGACSLAGSELTGMFDEWEWIDDTSNHTHSANQVGRLTCMSQRSANAITLMSGDTRCCFHTR